MASQPTDRASEREEYIVVNKTDISSEGTAAPINTLRDSLNELQLTAMNLESANHLVHESLTDLARSVNRMDSRLRRIENELQQKKQRLQEAVREAQNKNKREKIAEHGAQDRKERQQEAERETQDGKEREENRTREFRLIYSTFPPGLRKQILEKAKERAASNNQPPPETAEDLFQGPMEWWT
ncbi:hypothetical protein F52700_1745 [Fusarium sp. NRRL 52700]|nr:hypothetical protein F52700_1745 [Fusarium sp. NRRL 52700]